LFISLQQKFAAAQEILSHVQQQVKRMQR